MTKLEIIEDTVAFYSSDVSRRSIKNNTCMYKGPEGRECAFQRVVVNDLSKYDESAFTFSASVLLACYNVTFKEQYKGHEKDYDFWNYIQQLHDNWAHWDKNGLTVEGLKFIEKLKNFIK